MEIEGFTKFFNCGNPGATINKNGRLYFGKGAVDKYKLGKYKSIVIYSEKKLAEDTDLESDGKLRFAAAFMEDKPSGSFPLTFRNKSASAGIKNFLNQHNKVMIEKVDFDITTDRNYGTVLFFTERDAG